jgi:hypothetical protein
MANLTTASLLGALRLNRDYNVQVEALAVTTHEVRRIRAEQQQVAAGAAPKGKAGSGAAKRAVAGSRELTDGERAELEAQFAPGNLMEMALALAIVRLRKKRDLAEEVADLPSEPTTERRAEKMAEQSMQVLEGRLRRAERALVQAQTRRAIGYLEDGVTDVPLPPMADREKVARHRIRLRRLSLSDAAGQRAWLRLHKQCNEALAKTEAAIEEEAVDAVGKKAKVMEVIFAGEESINAEAKLKAAENAVQGWFEKYEAVRAHLKHVQIAVPEGKGPRVTEHLQRMERLTRDEQRYQSWLENPESPSARKLSRATRARYRRYAEKQGHLRN